MAHMAGKRLIYFCGGKVSNPSLRGSCRFLYLAVATTVILDSYKPTAAATVVAAVGQYSIWKKFTIVK